MLVTMQQIVKIPHFTMQVTQFDLTMSQQHLTIEEQKFIRSIFEILPHLDTPSRTVYLKMKAGIRNQPLPTLAMFPSHKGKVLFYKSINGQIIDIEPVASISC